MFQTLVQAFKSKDLRKKLLWTLGILFIYRIGCWLPIPGLDVTQFKSDIGSSEFLGLLSSVTGGALSNGAILALGVIPYISASIIIQLLTFAIPALERLSKTGEEGRRKITLYTRIAALVFALIQSIAIVLTLQVNASALSSAVPEWCVKAIIVIVLVAGSMFTLWLGEKITDLGIGNGVSLLIFVGIVCSAGQAILSAITGIGDIANIDSANVYEIIIFAAMFVLVIGLIVFVDLAERKIPVNYAKQIKGRKMYGGQSTHIPIKVNSSGVLPIIFATAIVAFPQLVMMLFGATNGNTWYEQWLGTGTPLYFVANAILIFFFTYFYAQITFNPEDVSRTLQQNGGFIPGIRPGKPTMEYLKKISRRITFFGALYLALIFVVPTVALSLVPTDSVVSGSLVNAFTVTGLLIVVSVALEFDKQLDAQLMAKNYRGFLK